MNLVRGQQLGDYRIDRSIGEGGMGQVYLAEHVHLRKLYAIKVLPEELAADRQFVARFHDEARVMAELRHPHIVQVHYMGEDNGTFFLAMDFVLGPGGSPLSLHDHLKTLPNSRVPEAQARTWAMQIAEALAYAHERGVVHRDIKPANILLDAQNDVKLTDFGLAKAIGQEFIQSQIHSTMRQSLGGPTLSGERTLKAPPSRPPSYSPDKTLDGLDTIPAQSPSGRGSSGESILGTYDYMAPEQRGEGGAIDQRTDIYALGVLLYRMLTGKRPVGMAKPPSQVAGVSAGWDRVVSQCMADQPAERYPSAGEMLRDLKAIGGRSRRMLWWGLSAAALVVLGIVLVKVTSGDSATVPTGSRHEPAGPPNRAVAPTPAMTAAEVVPIKSGAETAWERVRGINDRGQGFGKVLDEAETVQRQAAELYAQKLFAQAKGAFADLQKRCEELGEMQAQRLAAGAARDAAMQAAEAARKAGAESDAASEWKAAEAASVAAVGAFETGRFGDVQEACRQATTRYNEAGRYALAQLRARLARDMERRIGARRSPGGLRAYLGDSLDGGRFHDWRRGADAEIPDAMSLLGLAYLEGIGCPKDDAKAVEWLRKAAEAGEARAMSNLGVMYEKGHGVPKDDSKAVDWFRKAAEAGETAGMHNLGSMYEEGRGVPMDDAKAMAWFLRAVEAGDAAGMYKLGVMYENGRGIPMDGAKAVEWYRKAAEAGNAAGMCRLGVMYENGRVVSNDDAEAVVWYRKAAEAGDAAGMCSLGWMYQRGCGVPRDDAKAVEWFRKAAAQGHEGARRWLEGQR